MFYFVVLNNHLVNIYDQRPNPQSLPPGAEIWERDQIPPGVRVGYVWNGSAWAAPPPPPPTPTPNWQLFMDKLDVPERGGNGGYAEALNSPAKLDAMQAYNLCLLFTKGLGGPKELLTFWYHVGEVIRLKPELQTKLQEALDIANIPGA